MYVDIRGRLETNGIIQANHPIPSGGLFAAADYNLLTGTIDTPYYWASDFEAMELINGGYDEYLPYYLDLISRGKIVQLSVSDSHSYASRVGRDRTCCHAS